MRYEDVLKLSKKEMSLNWGKGGTQKLLKLVAAMRKVFPDFSYESDVEFEGLAYVVTVAVHIGNGTFKAVGVVDNPSDCDEKFLETFYKALKLAGIGISYPQEDTKKAAGIEDAKALIDELPDADLQHIVMNHITKRGKDFKKVFENYNITDPAQLTPKICKRYLKSEIEKGESIEI